MIDTKALREAAEYVVKTAKDENFDDWIKARAIYASYANPQTILQLLDRLDKLEAAIKNTIKQAEESAERSRLLGHPETSCGSCHLDFLEEIIDALAALDDTEFREQQ